MMMSPYITAVRLAAVFLFAIYTVNVNAQAAVRESSPVTATATTNAIPAAASPSTTVVAPASPVPPPATSPNLAYQIQQLQQEILELRGLLEEQSFGPKTPKPQYRTRTGKIIDEVVSKYSATALVLLFRHFVEHFGLCA